ncbi:AIM24 family protein, partial [Klebsiella pneumoniae]|nr:AIM24 family protein [Klebsiella pneumoniae]
VKFEHAGSGGMSRFVKKAVTGEGQSLMKIEGSGEVFLADLAQDIQLLKLDNEAITANGANVLAFEDGIDWDIKRVEGASGMLGGGLYNMH